MARLSKVHRRDFLKLTGLSSAGLVLQTTFSSQALASQPIASTSAITGATPAQANGLAFNVFVHIAENNRVTIMAHRSEMGQGIRTSLPQIVADEMEADWDKVDILQAQGDEKYGEQDTDSSHSVRSFYHTMREMGASAKLMLRLAAAAQWQVAVETCIAKDHRISHAQSGQSLSYGELALAAAKQAIPDPKLLNFKSEKDFKYIGKPMAMVDFGDMVSGKSQYGIDAYLPDMVYASIERCPVLGGKVKSFDASKALQVAGVLQAIKMDGGTEPAGFYPLAGIAIIATNTWAALQGRKALSIVWEGSEHNGYDSRATIEALTASHTLSGKVVRNRGDIDSAFLQAALTHEAVYSVPHLEHATLEPVTATARISGDTCEIWACVQNPLGARDLVASLLGFKANKVAVNVTLLGGGFGRKSKPDFVAEAALLAKATGKPVKVTWSREDTIRHGYYHAFSVQHYRAAFDKAQQLIGIDAIAASPTIMSLFQPNASYLSDDELAQGFANMPCNVPHLRCSNEPVVAHTRIGWMRSVHNINYAFGYNSFMDELARLCKRDPLAFQLAVIGDDREINTKPEGFTNPIPNDFPFTTARLKNVFRAVKKSSHWPAKVSASEGWGVAAHSSFLSYVAVASKVQLKDNTVHIMEVHIAIDCGQVVNPDRVRSQMEGAVIFGLSAALFGEITFKNGAVEQSNFDDYPLLRITQSPSIVVTIINSNEKHSGVGEPGVPPIGASITNAIVAAGGVRIRDLPVQKYLMVV